MAEKWATNEAVFARVPEFIDDEELGGLSIAAKERAIEDATQQVWHTMQSRYDLSLLIGLSLTVAPTLPRSIQDFTADVAAWILLSRHQRGQSDGKLEDYFAKLIHLGKQRILHGSLLDDTGVLIATVGGPEIGAYDIKGPEIFGSIYEAGGDSDRYGVPNTEVRSDLSTSRDLLERV